MTILAVYSNKGGVGKTATAVNLAYMAACSGRNTLICDLDPQGAATYYFRVKPKIKSGAKGLLAGGGLIDRSIKGSDFEHLDLLPADFTYRNLDIRLNRIRRSRRRLEKIFKPFRSEYDLIVLDCPAALNLLAENIFYTADVTLVPLIPTTLSLRTHRQLLSFYRKKKMDADNIYVFFSMTDIRKNLHREIMASVSDQIPNVLDCPVPYLSHVERMGIERAPVAAFAPRSAAAAAYERLWLEVRQII